MPMSRVHTLSTGLPLMAAVTASAWRRRCLAFTAILAVGFAGVPATFAQGSFQGLGDLPGGLGSHAYALSSDGSVVVGFSYYIATGGLLQSHAFRWTQGDGMHAVFEGGLDYTSAAFSVSADGLTIGGWHAPTIVEVKAFLWSAATGEQQLATRSSVTAISGSGTVAAGGVSQGRGTVPRAAIWDINRHLTFIDRPGVIPTSDARGISGDGTVVVGQAVFASSSTVRAFRWTASSGMQNIGSPDFSGPSSHADAITPDGSIIVGAAQLSAGGPLQAAMWIGSSNPQILGALPGAAGTIAYAVSADGGTVVGASGGHAFVWRQGRGVEDLQTVLSLPAGWTLTEARGISADGTIIVGTGSLVGVGGQPWIATLPPPGAPTVTPAPTVTFTRTGTPSSTPTGTSSVMPTRCTGDCDGNGMVGINELISGVNIALDNQPVSACPAFESPQGKVDIVQLLKGVNHALNGCGSD